MHLAQSRQWRGGGGGGGGGGGPVGHCFSEQEKVTRSENK